MREILALNAISDKVKEYLPENEFDIVKESAAPQAILVRSADMHSYELPDSVIAVARAGAGTNNIPSKEYAEKGVVVFNTPGANANAVKELTLCALLLSGRDIIGGAEWVQTLKGEGDQVPKLTEKGKKQFVGPELKGKKLGVIGLGAIGVLVANAALHLGMEVMGYDPFISIDNAWLLSRQVHRAASREQIYAECDFITMHVPLLDDTRGMINAETLAIMKPGVSIVNFSRGELVNNQDMIFALESGKVHRYVVDFPCEEMLGQKNAVVLPHIGASTPESEDNCAAMAAKELYNYIRYGNITNSVNYPAAELPYTGRTRIAVAHKNVANMVGQVTGVIAADNINISDMINKSRGDIAYTLIDVDGDIDQKVIDDIRAINGVIRVRAIMPQ